MKLFKISTTIVLLGLLAYAGSTASATVVTLQPTAAAADYQDGFSYQNSSSPGSGSGAVTGYLGATGATSLSYFVNFTGLSAYTGTDQTTDSATLTLTYYYSVSNSGDETLSVYSLLKPFDNGVDNSDRGGSLGAWSGSGGTLEAGVDYSATPVATYDFTGTESQFTPITFDVTTPVAAGLTGAAPDYGFVIMGSPGTHVNTFFGSGISSASGASFSTTQAPSLTFDVISAGPPSVPEPSTLALALLGAGVLALVVIFRRKSAQV